jgi:hypothetical protein
MTTSATASLGSLVGLGERGRVALRFVDGRDDFRCLRLAMARDCTPIAIKIERQKRHVLGAVSNGAKVTIAGKRPSMGGQTIHAGAVALDMLQFNKTLSLDEPNKILTAQSGAILRATHLEA